MAQELVKPTNDLIFKALFGQESSTSILISLLEAILQTKIESLTLKDPVIKVQDINDKSPVLDIKVLTSVGEYINVEVQVSKQKSFINRTLYYWARLYGGQLQGGSGYHALKRAICINILDFCQFPDQANFHNIFSIQDTQQSMTLTDHFEMHFIELPKFSYDKENVMSEQNPLYDWLYFMKNADQMNEEDVKQMSEPVKKAYDKLVELNQDVVLRFRAIEREIGELDRITALAEAKEEGLELGLELGRQEGIEVGRHEGLKEGHKEGLIEGKRTQMLETLREDLLDLHGIDLNDYQAKVQTLSLDQIRELRKLIRKPKYEVINDLEQL